MMKLLILISGLLLNLTLQSQCDVTAALPFPSTLTLNQGDTLCVNSTITLSTSIQIQSGGVIDVKNGATLKVIGAISTAPGGKILFDCTSKLEVDGTYTGVWNDCELEVQCLCSGATIPLTLLSGVKVWDDWCCINPLPIELISFEAYEIMEGRNSIQWTTASQVNNWYFECEKSKDGVNWESIVRVEGDNSMGEKTYALNDLATETLYYRLKQVDFDGTETLSKVVVVRKVNGREIIKRINFRGQEVGEDYQGMTIVQFNDGSIKIISRRWK